MKNQGSYPVTLMQGDGIGPEVTNAAIEVVAAAGVNIAWGRQLAGVAAVETVGQPIPEELIR